MAGSNGVVRAGHGCSALTTFSTFALFAALAIAPVRAQQNIPPAPSPSATPPASVPSAPAPQPSPPVKERFLVDKFPDKPSLSPTLTIPIDSLGFTAPGPIYLGSRNSMASLDFLDENHLLFTFRIPGLLHRDQLSGGDAEERQIRAVVLSLPKGDVEAQDTWTVHDRVRYLWPLNNGHFLLRDRNNLLEGDRTLTLKPYLDFPGPLLWIELDPSQHFLVTNSLEPVAKPAKPAQTENAAPASGSSASDSTSATGADSPDLVVRILHRNSGDVMLVSRVRTAVHLAINSDGYLENTRDRGMDWILSLSYFTGGSHMLGRVQSNCEPDDQFLSEQEILSTTCGPSGESGLVAMTTAGKLLWQSQAPATEVWPQLAVAANGSRFAWETLDTTHAIYAYAPLSPDDVKEQSVTVFDAANGDIAMVSPVSPILDAGGNVAVSPSGRRVALLNAGGIQVFDLPAPPPLPANITNPSSK
ncbi:MAG TPA: hypothetical protein VMT38_00820 [Terracidiphilus sp.]|nr:hypothetical protein [Terracidiphilus sp.]